MVLRMLGIFLTRSDIIWSTSVFEISATISYSPNVMMQLEI